MSEKRISKRNIANTVATAGTIAIAAFPSLANAKPASAERVSNLSPKEQKVNAYTEKKVQAIVKAAASIPNAIHGVTSTETGPGLNFATTTYFVNHEDQNGKVDGEYIIEAIAPLGRQYNPVGDEVTTLRVSEVGVEPSGDRKPYGSFTYTRNSLQDAWQASGEFYDPSSSLNISVGSATHDTAKTVRTMLSETQAIIDRAKSGQQISYVRSPVAHTK